MTETSEWEPFTGQFEKRWYNLKLKGGKTVLACWPHAGNFHSFNDQDARLGKIVPSRIAQIQTVEHPFLEVRQYSHRKAKKRGSRQQD